MHPLCDITRITYSIEGETLFRGMCIACTLYKTHQQGKVLQGHHISKQGRLLPTNNTNWTILGSMMIASENYQKKYFNKIIRSECVCVGHVYHTDEEQTLT